MKIKMKILQSGAAYGPQKIEKLWENHSGKRSRARGGFRGLFCLHMVKVSWSPLDKGTPIVMGLSLWSPSLLWMQYEQEGTRRPLILWVRGEEGET